MALPSLCCFYHEKDGIGTDSCLPLPKNLQTFSGGTQFHAMVPA